MSKLKIKLALLAPVTAVRPGGDVVLVNSQFVQAFQKLCADPVSITDRFRLAKTEKTFDAEIAAYEKARHALIERLGVKQSVLLQKEIDALNAGEKDARRIALQKRLDAVKKHPDRDGFAIDGGDAKALAEFKAEIEKLQAEDVDTDLTKKVSLREASKLTASEIGLLMDLVEPLEETVPA